jgi:hypothetical protein
MSRQNWEVPGAPPPFSSAEFGGAEALKDLIPL